MTLDINIPPGDLPAGSFGRILSQPSPTEGRRQLPTGGYEITPLDVIYLTLSAATESGAEPGRTIWCQLQRFVGHYCNGVTANLRLGIERFSQPVNPAWAYVDHLARGMDLNRPANETNRQKTIRMGRNLHLDFPSGTTVINGSFSRPTDVSIPASPSRGGTINARRQYDNWNAEGTSTARPASIARNRQAGRQSNIIKIQDIYRGGSTGTDEWLNISSSVRRCVYDTLDARNGIDPRLIGFDDFASYSDSSDGRRNAGVSVSRVRIQRVYNMSPSQRNTFLDALRERNGFDTRRRRTKVPVKFTQGGEWYFYHTAAPFDYGRVYIRTVDGRTSTNIPPREYVYQRGRSGSRRGHRGVGESESSGTVRLATIEDTEFTVYNILSQEEIEIARREWIAETTNELNGIYAGRRRRY